MNWHLKAFDELSNLELYHILKARTNIFVVEQNCPYSEVDGRDPACHHLYLEDNGEIVAYLRILPPGVVYPEASVGRFIVDPKLRGTGLGRELFGRGLAIVREQLRETRVKIHAQAYLQDFYASFGFKPVSDIYLEDGIQHIEMLLSPED